MLLEPQVPSEHDERHLHRIFDVLYLKEKILLFVNEYYENFSYRVQQVIDHDHGSIDN